MVEVDEVLVRGSDNALDLSLTEDGVEPGFTPTRILVRLENGITIDHSTPFTGGMDFVSGNLQITPGDLTPEDLSTLVQGQRYRVKIRLFTSEHTNGVVFGEDDQETHYYLTVQDVPT